jgi:hypothetical protein
MDKNKGIPKKINTKGIPEIGGLDKQIEDSVAKHMQKLIGYLDPLIQNINLGIETLEKRVAVVEEVKKLFPDKVEVIVKHENPDKKVT